VPPVQREFRVTTDILVIGGGIVGLSTAMQLTERYPDVSVTVIEKETALAAHQTGHNSGVIHAGVYYAPGSLKARFCREGSEATYAFCHSHGLPVQRCGKLIVATNPLEELRLEDLLARCRSNGLAPQWIDGHELRRIEPHIVGRSAILVSTSGIADYPAIARKMAAIVEQRGGKVLLDAPVMALRESSDGVIADTPRLTLRARFAIVCAGLMADRLAGMCGIPLDFKIVPFRGEYFRLPDAMNGIVSRLIYPVPNPDLPFLGVHLTRMIGGYVTVGPNAVLALAREGYRWRDLNARDLLEMAMFPGLRKMLRQHGRSAVREFVNSVFKRGYLAECTKYCPELTLEHLEPYPAGVRAQAVQADGTMIHDFLIKRSRRSLHVCNAPSPAATAALPIGRHLVDRFSEEFSFPATSSAC
jgi:L-2-hydroxyglutarate oxidase